MNFVDRDIPKFPARLGHCCWIPWGQVGLHKMRQLTMTATGFPRMRRGTTIGLLPVRGAFPTHEKYRSLLVRRTTTPGMSEI